MKPRGLAGEVNLPGLLVHHLEQEYATRHGCTAGWRDVAEQQWSLWISTIFAVGAPPPRTVACPDPGPSRATPVGPDQVILVLVDGDHVSPGCAADRRWRYQLRSDPSPIQACVEPDPHQRRRQRTGRLHVPPQPMDRVIRRRVIHEVKAVGLLDARGPGREADVASPPRSALGYGAGRCGAPARVQATSMIWGWILVGTSGHHTVK